MCLATWLASEADEVILVVDVDDDECLRVLAQVDDPRLVVLDFVHRGKRSALGAGVRAATGEVVVLSDSDTLWRDGLLTAVQMPFVDPLVGAVGTHQNVYQRTTSIWRRIADWMLNLRYYDYVPAMGRKGAVVCVSGRTAAYRRSVIIPVLHHLEHEFFFGRRCVAGDDGRLTWLVLGSGFRTVHQSSARAISILPDTFTAFVKQRVRWARNSYRTYLTAAWKGWLWRAPFVSKVTVLQILLTPLTMGLSFSYVVSGRLELSAGGVILALVWVLVGRAIRSYSHLRRHPGDLLILPLYALVVIFVAMPIKAYAFVTMNKQGWLTRSDETIGGEGQRASTLVHEPV
jgi:hyaluronan synthase